MPPTVASLRLQAVVPAAEEPQVVLGMLPALRIGDHVIDLEIPSGAASLPAVTDERTTAMPPFGDKLAREQIWLVITYLQSLDVYTQDRNP